MLTKMLLRKSGMRIPWKNTLFPLIAFALFFHISNAQDYDDPATPVTPPPEIERCDGVFVSYLFQGREKEYPFVKNASAQAWSFKSTATVLNTGDKEVKSWKIYIGFQHNELLVSVDGAVVVDADGFPIRVGKNGTTLAGFPQSDLKTAIETAADLTQMQVEIGITGTQFGVADKGTPMPKTIKLVNEGYKCPVSKPKGSYMYACCTKDPKFKEKNMTTKFLPRKYSDLTFTYDVLKAYDNRYLAQVTIDNNHPLGRLDQWNLTWEWMRNEFIYNMRGAYTHKRDSSDCVYGRQGQYYKDFDFSPVMNCQKKPIIGDLPPEKENDDKVGKLPYCCKNGTLLPKTMNETKARAIFQLEVYKLPPDLNRTAINPPQNWKISGRVNPEYKCGPPVRVDQTEFPDPTGLDSTTSAVASWQINCNITSPKPKQARCCVSYSAYYSDGAVPCNTCACGCAENAKCDKNAPPLLLPSDALLVPFVNRSQKALAFANIKHKKVPAKLPCGDNCGVSVNWHVDSDYKTGWTARMTLFNWEQSPYADWFAAVQLNKAAPGFEKTYSFNGTRMKNVNNTIFMQGLPGLNYLVAEVDGPHPDRGDPRVPGKQQTVISFTKKNVHGMNVPMGDGFPTKLFFNGEECALPKVLPKRVSGAHRSTMVAGGGLVPGILVAVVTFLVLTQFS